MANARSGVALLVLPSMVSVMSSFSFGQLLHSLKRILLSLCPKAISMEYHHLFWVFLNLLPESFEMLTIQTGWKGQHHTHVLTCGNMPKKAPKVPNFLFCTSIAPFLWMAQKCMCKCTLQEFSRSSSCAHCKHSLTKEWNCNFKVHCIFLFIINMLATFLNKLTRVV